MLIGAAVGCVAVTLYNAWLQVRTAGWLLGVIEQLYTEVEVRQRKLGDSLAVAGKMNMPDITFAYFLQKYGRKNLVDEYVGSLVNTLERFREVGFTDGLEEWLVSSTDGQLARAAAVKRADRGIVSVKNKLNLTATWQQQCLTGGKHAHNNIAKCLTFS